MLTTNEVLLGTIKSKALIGCHISLNIYFCELLRILVWIHVG